VFASLGRRAGRAVDFLVDPRGRVQPATWLSLNAMPLKAGVAALAAAALVPPSDLNSGVREAGSVVWTQAAAAFDGRSPGIRRIREYVKGQRARPAARAKPPVRAIARPPARPRRAVASTRPPVAGAIVPPADLPIAFDESPLLPGPDNTVLLANLPPVEQFAEVIVPDLPGPKGFVFIGGPPTGTVPVPPIGPGTPPINPPGPPGIPEPSSWATMILGFLMLGWAWRRRRVILRVLTHVAVPLLSWQPTRP
jgi:hypothetical protein